MTPEREPRLWLFNLDAELELARPRGYQAPLHVARALEPWVARAARLLEPGDELYDPRAPSRPGGVALKWGVAWCPTPSALRALMRAGARLEPTPALEVLRRVNHRSFYLGLGGGAPGARFFQDAADLEAALLARGSAPWLFKRGFGFAGRGQRLIPVDPSADDRRWLADSLRQGGVLGEPWLQLERELCLHGYIEASGVARWGNICVQRTDARRAWLVSELARPEDVNAMHEEALRRTGERVAAALWGAGYFGPFGIDAYLWRTPDGGLELNPLGELNARYTMGFATGMRRAETG